MLKSIFILILLYSFPTLASWQDAISAYEQKDYVLAKQHFADLLIVGNSQAIFSLAAMAFNGEGQNADNIKAAALFKLAANYGHKEADKLAANLADQFNETQHLMLEEQLAYWQNKIAIPAVTPQNPASIKSPSPLKRFEPAYPMSAARNGLAGFVHLYFLVNDQGQAVNIKVIDSFPGEAFVAAAIKALTQWQYPTAQPHLASVKLSFTLEIEGQPRLHIKNLDKALFQNKLWDAAQAGSAEHQFFLSQLLQYIAEQSAVHFIFDKDLPISKPDLTVLEQRNVIKASLSSFSGTAEVQTDNQGEIIALLEGDNSANQVLLGQKLQGVTQADVFRLQSYNLNNKQHINVIPAVMLSNAWSADYWLEQSARNGYRPAQQILATKYDDWLHYLVTQQDPEALVWQGTKLILGGNTAQGKPLLEQAHLAGYNDATLWQQALLSELERQ